MEWSTVWKAAVKGTDTAFVHDPDHVVENADYGCLGRQIGTPTANDCCVHGRTAWRRRLYRQPQTDAKTPSHRGFGTN